MPPRWTSPQDPSIPHWTRLSDHCILTINSFIPVVVNHSTSIINPPSSVIESLNFNKCDWELLITTLCDIDWSVLLADL